MRAAVPLSDAARVAALHRLGVLDQPPAADLEGLTRLASFATGAPMSVVNLLDADRQWQAAATGMACGEVPRSDSMCAHTVAEDRLVHLADASQDRRFAATPFVDGRLGQVRMYAAVPLHDVEGYPVGTLCVVDPRVRQLTATQLSALRDLAAQAEQLLELRRQHVHLLALLAEVDHFACHDPLTGLVNRRVLLDRLEQALRRATASGRPVTLLLCDVDGFKGVNDVHGHQDGDEALIAVARGLAERADPSCTVARLGGDEFVVLSEDLTEQAAGELAITLRTAPYGARALRLSVGLTRPAATSTPREALAAADAAMYADKRRGGVPAQRPGPPGEGPRVRRPGTRAGRG